MQAFSFSCTLPYTFSSLLHSCYLILFIPPELADNQQSFTSFNSRVKVSPTEWSFCLALITGPGLGSFPAFSPVLASLGALATGPGISAHFCKTNLHFLALIVQFYQEADIVKDTCPATFQIYPKIIYTLIHIQLHTQSYSCFLTADTLLLPPAQTRCHHAHFLPYCCELTPGMVANMHPHPLLIVGRDQRNSGLGGEFSKAERSRTHSPRVWDTS